jgi:hypothetical protein
VRSSSRSEQPGHTTMPPAGPPNESEAPAPRDRSTSTHAEESAALGRVIDKWEIEAATVRRLRERLPLLNARATSQDPRRSRT